MTRPTVDSLELDADTEVIEPIPLRAAPQVTVSDFIYYSMNCALPEHQFGYFRLGVR